MPRGRGSALERGGRVFLSLYHLDTDFLIYSLERDGAERCLLLELTRNAHFVEMSAVAWYEFSRGPRSPQQLAATRSLFARGGIIPFSEELAAASAEMYLALGSPRKRGNDVAIAVTALAREATLLTHNPRDFDDIPGLQVAHA